MFAQIGTSVGEVPRNLSVFSDLFLTSAQAQVEAIERLDQGLQVMSVSVSIAQRRGRDALL